MTTFTRRTVSVDETDGTSSEVVTTIEGAAIQVRGKPDTYQKYSLVPSQAPTLLFTPTDYDLRAHTDDFVLSGDTVVWAGQTYTALDVEPIAPDGFVIMARILVQG